MFLYHILQVRIFARTCVSASASDVGGSVERLAVGGKPLSDVADAKLASARASGET